MVRSAAAFAAARLEPWAAGTVNHSRAWPSRRRHSPARMRALRVRLRRRRASARKALRLPLRSLIGQQRAELERLERRLVALLVEELAQARVVAVLLVGGLDRLALGGE